MKSFIVKKPLLLLFCCALFSSCITIQQPLPGSLWGNWNFIETGTLYPNGKQSLYEYRNACYKERDRIHFSSDNKMTLRWYDQTCGLHHDLLGRYRVENNILKITFNNPNAYQHRPFPPITAYRIYQINSTTLKLEEYLDLYSENRDDSDLEKERLIFTFIKGD